MKKGKKYIYTAHEDVFRYLSSVCGTYVDLTKFQNNNNPVPVDMEINIPIIDFLPLQCFSKWLKEMGSLYLEAYFTHSSQVCAICNPKDVLENKIYLDELTPHAPHLAGAIGHFPHRFTQVGDPMIVWGTVLTSGDDYDKTMNFAGSQIIHVNVTDPWIMECASTIRGYGITDRARNAIMAKLHQRPLIIPAQELQKQTFPASRGPDGLDTALNVPYKEVTCAAIVFPKTQRQITVYENPMLNNLQLKIADKLYPNKAYSTVGARYLQEQIIIADLDGALQATDSRTASIVNVRDNPQTGA
jgi:hypothetical protein